MSAVLAPRLELDPETCGNCGNGSLRATGFVRCACMKPHDWMSPKASCPIKRWTPVTAETKARRDAQDGIDRAVEAAEREIPDWSDVALSWVKLYATMNRGKKVIGYDIVQASLAHKIIQPSNAKALGGPIQRAARMGYIVKVGTAEDPNRHANPVPLWECVGA